MIAVTGSCIQSQNDKLEETVTSHVRIQVTLDYASHQTMLFYNFKSMPFFLFFYFF